MFATVADLEDYLQRTFTVVETNAATQAIELASGVIRAYTSQHISPATTGVVLEVFDVSTSRVFLPHPPAIPVMVTQIEENGVLLDADDWRVVAPINAVERVHGRWSGTVKITYSHGFADTPSDVTAVVLQAAQRALTNPQGIQSERLGQYSITYTEGFGGSLVGAGVQLTNVEMRMMDRYRLQGVA